MPSGGGGGVSPGSGRGGSSGASPAAPGGGGFQFVPDVEEIRVSPIISKRGALNVLDQRNKVREGFFYNNARKELQNNVKLSINCCGT